MANQTASYRLTPPCHWLHNCTCVHIETDRDTLQLAGAVLYQCRLSPNDLAAT
eukprot:m.113949 g.113949  ORF g.113949 m.113949 type:complete len:53 (+) comp16273_c2_seq3:489-647(+)